MRLFLLMFDMPSLLKSAKEEETYVVEYAPLNQLKIPVTPVTLTWSLFNLSGSVINSRSDISISPTKLVNHIVMSGNDLALDVANTRVQRVLLIKATYNTEIDDKPYNGLPIYIEARFWIEPVMGVS